MSDRPFDASHTKLAQSMFDHIRELSRDGAGVTRPSYSDIETGTLAYLAKQAEAEGLETSHDLAGNLWMTVAGSDPALPRVIAGSHVDSVPQGGNFDGLAGVIAGLACGIRMRREGIVPKRTFTALALRGEESAWFGKPYLGSAALLGRLTEQDLALKHRDTGYPLNFHMRECGADPRRLIRGESLIDPRAVAAFLELHIEQGPILENSDHAVGVVTGIRGNFRHRRIRCIGTTGHSGAVPKSMRQDAVFAVAELLSRVEAAWEQWLRQGHDLVVTTGVLQTNAATHAPSVIPGEVTFSLEARSESKDTLTGFRDAVIAECGAIGERRGVRFEFDAPVFSSPAMMDARIVDLLVSICEQERLRHMRIPSGAGHDAAMFANAGIRSAMVFVRNQHGSHNPEEDMRIEDLMAGTTVLYEATLALQ
jgi:N-carbamoyl-L-amino-acid hydrolase